MLESLSQGLSILASIGLFATMALYFRQVLAGQSTPNVVSYLILTVTSVMNTATFYRVVGGDLFKVLPSMVMTGGLTVVFLYTLYKRAYGRMTWVDPVCFVLAVSIGIFWQTSNDAELTNLFLQSIFVVATIPIVVGILEGTLREKAFAWEISLVSYALMVLGLLCDWKPGSASSLIYPIVNGLGSNGAVVFAIYRVRKRSVEQASVSLDDRLFVEDNRPEWQQLAETEGRIVLPSFLIGTIIGLVFAIWFISETWGKN